MAGLLSPGQIFKGRTGVYTVTKQLQECIWLAKNETQQPFLLKSVQHFRLQNEHDVLRRFQARTPYIRPLIEALDTHDPPTLILKHFSHLHADGFVHTDIKPSNILLNYGGGNNGVRFSAIHLADFGSTVPKTSMYAQRCDSIGTPIFRSPEAQLQMQWDTATDIWSFGATGFHIFKPDVSVEHDEYNPRIQMKHHRCFGPFPESYEEIADPQRLAGTLRPFRQTTAREICREDREFVLKVMRLDPRDRPSARELLADGWFRGE
ncbi:kinase-like protein [Aspergillus homomorphus CBS 101889]|uniref:Kinase-like protein n=1 Tax=Aspergillus homomorphus (strain CBS 101889) TaxID=1450537 RepID=A0A395I0W6_ASPHC|nr:kinase-like protein [Aspergillus homomorphus CBS 101889]RAL13842.1 kinase-like protein [Aspergillus homomorphus CBS 101889]